MPVLVDPTSKKVLVDGTSKKVLLCCCPRDIRDINSITVETTIEVTDNRVFPDCGSQAVLVGCRLSFGPTTKSRTWNRVDRFDADGNVIGDPGTGEFQIWWSNYPPEHPACDIFNILIGDSPEGDFPNPFGAAEGIPDNGSCNGDQSVCNRGDICRTEGGGISSPPCGGDRRGPFSDCFSTDGGASGDAFIYYDDSDPDDKLFRLAASARYSLACGYSTPEVFPCGGEDDVGEDPITSEPTLAALIGSYTVEDTHDTAGPCSGSYHRHMKTVVTIA